MSDKYAILNVTAIVNMIEDAKIKGYGDTEEMYMVLNELVSILEQSDSVEQILSH